MRRSEANAPLNKTIYINQLLDGHGVKPPTRLITGVSSIPPLNAHIGVKGPILSDFEHKNDLNFIFKQAGIKKLPKQFSWLNPDDYKKYHHIQHPIGIMTKAVHQHNCGACWSIAAATSFSDRYAIVHQSHKSPHFSYTAILNGCVSAPRCSENDAGCCGGVLFDAVNYICEVGIPTYDCIDDTWMCPHDTKATFDACGVCKTDELVSASCVDVSKQIPENDGKCYSKCVIKDNKNVCDHSAPFKRYKGVKGTPMSIGEDSNPIEHMMINVFRWGPLAVTYMVYADFIVGSTPDSYNDADGWKKTKNIYVNVPGYDIYNYSTISTDMCVRCRTVDGLLCECACILNDKCTRSCSLCVDDVGNRCDCSCLNVSKTAGTTTTRCDSNCKKTINKSMKIPPNRGYMGNHSVVIVGWGVENDVTIEGRDYITNQVTRKHFDELPYWIVRNSWGPCWMKKFADDLHVKPWGAPAGFFKVAMYQKDVFGPGQGINEMLYLDHIGSQVDPMVGRFIKVGGGVTFHVDASDNGAAGDVDEPELPATHEARLVGTVNQGVVATTASHHRKRVSIYLAIFILILILALLSIWWRAYDVNKK